MTIIHHNPIRQYHNNWYQFYLVLRQKFFSPIHPRLYQKYHHLSRHQELVFLVQVFESSLLFEAYLTDSAKILDRFLEIWNSFQPFTILIEPHQVHQPTIAYILQQQHPGKDCFKSRILSKRTQVSSNATVFYDRLLITNPSGIILYPFTSACTPFIGFQIAQIN